MRAYLAVLPTGDHQSQWREARWVTLRGCLRGRGCRSRTSSTNAPCRRASRRGTRLGPGCALRGAAECGAADARPGPVSFAGPGSPWASCRGVAAGPRWWPGGGYCAATRLDRADFGPAPALLRAWTVNR